jgi:hypothetical protein
MSEQRRHLLYASTWIALSETAGAEKQSVKEARADATRFSPSKHMPR